jgi:signal transduction histidine kinase
VSNTELDIPLRSSLAETMRKSRDGIVTRWLERINARVAISENEIFPTADLINHVPLLLDGIADYLEGRDGEIDQNVPVTAKAMELGALRHAQGFDAYEILKEHEILIGIIYETLRPVASRLGENTASADLLECWESVGHAVELIRQATVTQFLRLAAERVAEREDRLRRFNRMVAHELKNRVGALRGAAHMLQEPWLDAEQESRFDRMIVENSEALLALLSNLESLSRLESDARQRKNVLLPQAVSEAARQMRSLADGNNVEIRIAADLPAVEVDAAAVELCISNLLSYAIKYADASKDRSWVEVSGELIDPAKSIGELVVRVRDNGIGVPEKGRSRLFQQFYRAHGETVTNAEGTGLGLSLVRETAETLGGRAWAEFPSDGGLIIAISFPSRREEDAAAAGTRRSTPAS